MLAVIKTGGKQYLIKEGDIISVEKIERENGESFDIGEVLLVANDKKIEIGDPTVKNYQIKATLISQKKAKKVIIFKYKSKKRYRVTKGHRQKLTKIKIEKIAISSKSEVTKKEPKKTVKK